MSVLTGKQIKREYILGRIFIDPFDESRLNPNSYNLRLDRQIKVYGKNYPVHAYHARQMARTGLFSRADVAVSPLDMKSEEETIDLVIPGEGMTLFPGVLYLACTMEAAGSDHFVPCIEGRSSVGRMGICAHVTAGFGDLGFSGYGRPAQWTLEVTVVHPVTVYAGVEFCQIVFTTPEQERELGQLPIYEGKYAGQRGPKASGLWKDFLD